MNLRDILVGAAWLLLAGFGFSCLSSYANSPGPQGNAPAMWPENAQTARDTERATLVMLAHPHCPCTRASLRELDVLMTQCAGKVSAHVLFYRPSDQPDDWARTDFWQHAASTEGVRAHTDPSISHRSEDLFRTDSDALCRRTDHLFAGLTLFQFVAGNLAAVFISPRRTWPTPAHPSKRARPQGSTSSTSRRSASPTNPPRWRAIAAEETGASRVLA